MNNRNQIQLNAPAGDMPSLMAAVDAGADSVYIGFSSPTNLRNLPGLNFSLEQAAKAVQYAHKRGAKVYIAVNTHPTDRQLDKCFRAVDNADDVGADVLIAADLAVLEYARDKHQRLEIHLSCSAGVTDPEAIRFYQEEFGVTCVVLPRVLSIEHIAALRRRVDVLLEVMVFGVLCANYDGSCCLSSFITGASANSVGACSPAQFVQLEESKEGQVIQKLNGLVINEYLGSQKRTYPMPCKGKYYNSSRDIWPHTFQDLCCLNALPVLPELAAAGVDIVKIEGRQRSLAYVRSVTSVWRSAIDALGGAENVDPHIFESTALDPVLEGTAGTLGPFKGG